MQIELRAERIEELVSEQLRQMLSEHAEYIQGRLEREMKEAWLKQIATQGRTLFDSAFQDLLDNGWKVTNGYGQYEKTLTLRDHCIAALVSGGNGYDSRDRLEKTLMAAIEQMLKREFSAAIETAKKEITARVDAALIGAIKDSLKTALGGAK